MPLDRHDIMALLAQLAEEEQMRVTVKGSAYGAMVAGLGAFLGGLAMGPPGLLIGGSLGGGAGYAMSAGKFESVAAVIRGLPQAQQRQLADKVRHLVSRLRAEDVVMAATMLAAGGGMVAVRSMLLGQMVQFLSSEMAMEVIRG